MNGPVYQNFRIDNLDHENDMTPTLRIHICQSILYAGWAKTWYISLHPWFAFAWIGQGLVILKRNTFTRPQSQSPIFICVLGLVWCHFSDCLVFHPADRPFLTIYSSTIYLKAIVLLSFWVPKALCFLGRNQSGRKSRLSWQKIGHHNMSRNNQPKGS